MGEIQIAKRGKYWQYKFESAKVDGKRQRISKSGFKTKAEATAAGAQAQAEYNEAGLSFTPSELSVNDFFDYWLDTYCKVNLKDVTMVNYVKKIRLHIKPELGKYKLKALTSAVLQKFINKKAQQNYARNTLSVIKGILSGSLGYAVKQEMIKSNPMLNVTLPSPRNENLKPRTAPHVYIPKNRIAEIFERFPEGTSTHIPMMLGYKAGLRLEETFGVIWDDIDFENNRLKVDRQVQWNEKKKLWYFSDPKYNSFRLIDLDRETVNLLLREKERQDKAKVYYAEHYTHLYINKDRQLNTVEDGSPVYPVMVHENGEFIIPRSMQHTSGVIHKQLEYTEFDFHSLRHTHASFLAENDVSPKYLQNRMGHANLQVTMKFYLHLTEKMQEKGVSLIDKLYQSNDVGDNE